MQLIELVEIHEAVGSRSGRLEKIDRLASLLRRAAPHELGQVVSYLSARLPQGRIGLGPATLAGAREVPAAESPSLSITELHQAFDAITSVSGKGSSAERVRLVHALFRQATTREQEFVTRLVLGELRQGALDGIMVEAVARACGTDASRIRRAVSVTGDVATVAHAALTRGVAALGAFGLELFRPIQPMLAQPAEALDTALDDAADALLEYKLDGARIQVHKDGDEVRVYSRRLREVTAAVPEVVTAARALPLRRALLDGEVLALGAGGAPEPFQVTMRRFGRRLDVDEMARTLPLTPFFFDLLHADGTDLLDEPLARRERALADVAGSCLVPRVRAGSPAEADAFLSRAMADGHEGIMVKSLAAVYEAGSRGGAWRKLKPVHTLDLVVLAAEWGHGRRRGLLSNLHLGARDPDHGGFVMLGKTFKGLTDAVLRWQTEALLAREIGREGHVVHVRPELVVEVAFNDVQASPQYAGGVALRFARVRRYRDDKSADEADTIETVRRIHTAGFRSDARRA